MAQCVPRLSAVQPAGDEMPLAVRPTRPEERRWRGLATCACALQGALTVVLIAIVAWLGATVRDQRATLDALQARGAARARADRGWHRAALRVWRAQPPQRGLVASAAPRAHARARPC